MSLASCPSQRLLWHRSRSRGGSCRVTLWRPAPRPCLHPSHWGARARRAQPLVVGQAQPAGRKACGGKAVSLPAAAYMEELYDWLASHALEQARTGGPGSKLLIGIAGGPGSGKSTLAREVSSRVNAAAGTELAVVVPMDGFHYYKRQLEQFEDPGAALARRGAHWTFDAQAYVDCIRRMKEQGEALVPSFDHGVGDPVDGDIQVTRDHQIVFSEGNYLLLDVEPWRQLEELFDETWFVECDIDVAMGRVYERQTGHGVAPDVSRGRIAGNDRPNAELIAGTKGRALVVVPSLPFKGAMSD